MIHDELKKKSLRYTICTYISFFNYNNFLYNNSILKSYTQFQYKEAEKQLHSIAKEFNSKVENLSRFALDWAVWDDTYEFIENKNLKYIESNLSNTTFINSKINFFLFYNDKSQLVYGKYVNLSKQKEISIPPELIEKTKNLKNKSGFILLQNGDSYIVSSHYITDSNKLKKANGILIIGYLITDDLLLDINKKLDIEITDFFISEIDNKVNDVEIIDYNNYQIIGKLYIETIDRKYIAVKISMDKSYFELGQKNSLKLLIALIFTLFFISAVFLFILNKIVIERIEKLTNDVVEITNFNNFNKRLEINGNDEISKLKNFINNMLDNIMKNKHKYEILYEETPALNIIIDKNGNILNANNSFLKLVQYDKDEIIGKNAYDFIAKEDFIIAKKIKNDISQGKKVKNIEIRILDKSSKLHTLLVNTTILNFENNKQYTRLITGIDITDRKKAQEELAIYATLDIMTGVYNRREGLNRLQKHIEISKETGINFTICFIDINNLKIVNDTYGHTQGDNLVIDTCNILKKCIRDSDMIMRLGGDEFLILFPRANLEDAINIFKRIEEEIDLFNNISGKKYKISVSKGFAEFDGKMDAAQLIDLADKRMYINKKKSI